MVDHHTLQTYPHDGHIDSSGRIFLEEFTGRLSRWHKPHLPGGFQALPGLSGRAGQARLCHVPKRTTWTEFIDGGGSKGKWWRGRMGIEPIGPSRDQQPVLQTGGSPSSNAL